jgi:cell division protein FtsN
LTNLFENDPSVRKLSVKELVEMFNNNPNNADSPATADIVKRFRTALNKKRKETEPASNPRSNPKDQTKKKRKK